MKTARIALGPKTPKIECAVRNLSEGGACLHVHSGTFGIPREFQLVFESGATHPCRVVWRTEQRLGVSFH
ncbi:hypothetical protein A33M_2721 [Rhodovulum sp. PH10]|nr:hypothetical protein A33M_2721 [Rhodovulum sp. PH10]